MSFKLLRRRYITLIEIMIVMFLIALITGVIAYNYRGSLDEGKAFKTKIAIEKIQDILTMKTAQDPGLKDNLSGEGWKQIIRDSPMVSNPNSLLKDGWGGEFEVTIDDNGNIKVTSEKYDAYSRTHAGTMFGKENQ